MSHHIQTFKLTLYLSIAAIVVVWMSIFTLTSSQLFDPMSGSWLFDLLSAMTLSMSLFYCAIVLKRLAKVLGIAIDVLAVFY
jgi:Cu/Ag efflux pump CusA